MVNFTGLNATLTAGCINAGCSIFSLPLNTTANQESGVMAEAVAFWAVYTPGWSICQPEQGNNYRIRYPDPRDAALAYAYDICSRSGLQLDEAACYAAKL